MKNYINKSAKRILSLALALVMLAGCLFTANFGSGITASAETDGTDPYADWNIQYWDGIELKNYDSFKQENGKYVIETAAQLQFAAAATRNGTTSVSSLDKSFVIDPSIDAFIMQPKSVVDKIGVKYFIEATSAEDTRILFEEKFAAVGATPVNWVSNGNYIFHGNFDGSGVPVYGIYADGVSKNIENVGFFPAHRDESSTNGRSIEVKNLVIKNCYFKGWRRVAILTGRAWGDVDGHLSADSCIFANCYLLGQNKKLDGSLVTYNTGEMGMIGGGMSAEPVIMSNTLVYGNKTKFDKYDENGNVTNETFDWIFQDNKNNGTYYGSVKNCIILDAVVDRLQADSTDYCSNVYSNVKSSYTTVTNMIDHASVKGAHGRYYMSGLGWDSEWWAIENDYPTPF